MTEKDLPPYGTLDAFCDALREHLSAWDSVLNNTDGRSRDFAGALAANCVKMRMLLLELHEGAWPRSGERERLQQLEQLIELCASLEGKAKELRNDVTRPLNRGTGTGAG